MNVLLVEDDPEMRALLKGAIELRGHTVADFGDAESAWQACQARYFPLLILDWLLPGMDGLDLCRKIRGNRSSRTNMILVVTGRTHQGDLEQILAAGADDYLTKPITPQRLNVRLAVAEQKVYELLEQAAAFNVLREKERHLDEAQRIARVGSWRLDLASDKLTLSNELFRILELAPSTPASYDLLLNKIHPADLDLVNQAYFESCSSRTPYNIDHRLCMPDGRIKRVRSHGETIFDDDGRALFSVGTVQDITESERVAEEQEFASLVYQAVGDAVLVTDSSNTIIAVNQAYTRLTGYSEAEAIGKNPSFQQSGLQNRAFYTELWHKLQTTGVWEGEIWNRHKDGHNIALWSLIHTSYDDNGNVLRRVALLSDITDQKRSEKTVRRQVYYDVLTGLPNRRLFHKRLDVEIGKSRRSGLPMALIFIELNHFRVGADKPGDCQEDALLIEAVRRIVECMRKIDTVSRLGGNKFAAIISEMDGSCSPERVAQDISIKLAAPYQLGDQTAVVSASIGTTLYPLDATETEALLGNAVRALHAAKRSGCNRVSHYQVHDKAA